MGKQIKFLLLFFITIFLFSLNFLSSAAPVLQTQNILTGYQIEIPEISPLMQNQDFIANFHVFNVSNGYPIDNSSTNCSLHLYNSSGDSLFEGEVPHVETDVINEWKITLLKENFSSIGSYWYIIQCNSPTTSLGGFENVGFEVTYTGKNIDTSKSIIYIVLFVVIILTFGMIMFFINKLPSSNQKDEEGKILSVTYLKYLRSPLWFMEYMLFVAILYLSSNLAFSYLYETLFAQILFVLFKISFGLAPVIVIVWIIWIYAKMFQDKQFQDMINRGIFPQGKL